MKNPDEKDYSKYDIDEMIKEYSDVGKSKSSIYSQTDEQPAEKKKFVVHMDESLMDIPDTDEEKAHKPVNGGGVYFSNFQKKHPSVRSASASGTASSQSNSNFKEKISSAIQSENLLKKAKQVRNKAALCFVAFIIIFTTLFSYLGIICVGDMLAINRSDENVAVSIPAESDYKDIIKILKKNKLIKCRPFCEWFIRFRDFDKATYLSGDYYLNSKMGIEGMMKDIMEEPVAAESITLSFPEGWTISQIAEKLEKNEVCKASQLFSSAKSGTYSFDFIASIVDNDKRYQKLEGYFFPDTYDLYVDADINYVIRKFLTNFQDKWESEYNARAEKLKCTQDEIVTIASIIQKEAANVDQMKKISSVIHNRLNNPSEYPTLGCDSTAIYVSNYVTPIVGETQGALYQSYYDTSAIKGLPPGPICNPGLDAIKAALYPEETNYYYFAHDKYGKIYLASTYQEHKSNLVLIIKANNK